jgi:hypothetical protein
MVGLGSGLISGLTGFSLMEKIEYSAFLVLVMAIVDSKYFLRGQRDDEKTMLTLEGTNLDPDFLHSKVEELLNVSAVSVKVKAVSLVPASTKIEVTYRKRNG